MQRIKKRRFAGSGSSGHPDPKDGLPEATEEPAEAHEVDGDPGNIIFKVKEYN
jgi:hypothetical protein